MSEVQRTIISAGIGTALALIAFGCGESSDTPAPPKTAEHAPAPPPAKAPEAPSDPDTVIEADAELGKADYQIFCASCHGESGDGDGPVAQALNPKPVRHSDGAYMNPLTDDYLFKVIKFGGTSVGKSAMMAPLGGSLSDQQIRNVIAFIRSLADPPYQP